jgi:hypothetical protein
MRRGCEIVEGDDVPEGERGVQFFSLAFSARVVAPQDSNKFEAE